MTRALVLISIFAIVLSACAEPSEPAAMDPTETSWLLESGSFGDEPVPIVESHPISLVFEEESAGGTSACNQFSAPYTISGGELSFGDITQTMMACTPEKVMDSETRYLEALALVDAFTASEDRLVLTGEGVELIFTPDEGARP